MTPGAPGTGQGVEANPSEPETTPSGDTVDADRRDARVDHRADREPTEDELAAIRGDEVDPSVAEAYEDAIERGANVKGEGSIE